MDDRRGGEVYGWRWGPDGDRRPGLPWIGIFLVIFGGLLLLEQVAPELAHPGGMITDAVWMASPRARRSC